MRRSALSGVIVVAWLACSPPAQAGRTSHLLARESQIVPEGDVELEQWLWGEGRVPNRPSRPVIQWVWWAPVVGVSPNLELAFPLQLVSGSEALSLESFGIDARYRFFPREQDEGLQPLVRVAYAHPLTEYGGAPRLDSTWWRSTALLPRCSSRSTWAAPGALPFLARTSRPADFFLTSAVGVSAPLPFGLRLGAEVFNRAPLAAPAGAANVLYAGASVAWAHGPFWITVGSLFGLTDNSPRVFPKVLWAVEL